MQETAAHPVLLFDGVCNLCSASVQFIIRHDPHARLRFAALQSDPGEQLLRSHHLPEKELKSLVLIEKGRVYTRSTGALRVARYLSGLWPLLYVFIIVPRFLRDPVYDLIGRNRYRWFGKKTSCWLPTPDLKARFIDQ
ncbi:MAG TPA: thiol-disulfide oxidoreductase DCC family protein [Phnomibacter sp.]|nr:thiol-disulfide oxidoreductase DCC family protein [Phnomibacter sp.]